MPPAPRATSPPSCTSPRSATRPGMWQEARARQAIVSEVLGPFVAGAHPLSLCAWLAVPDHWTEDGLIRALARKGIAATQSDPFIAGGERPAGGIRICLGGRLSQAALR